MSRRSVRSPRLMRDIDHPLFADAVVATLGRVVTVELAETDSGVEVRLFNPGDDDPVDFDEEVISSLLADHVAPPEPKPEPDPLDALETALAGANTVAKLRDALSGYVAGEKRARVRPDRPGRPTRTLR